MGWEETVLTDEKLGRIRAFIPGTTNVIEFAIQVSKKTAKAQAKATWEAAYNAGEMAERERILTWLKSFAKEHPNVVVRNRLDIVGAGKPKSG